jgi:UDP-N-acetylmuramoyl-tripeptide--D-alanyl-D-alanine ligase
LWPAAPIRRRSSASASIEEIAKEKVSITDGLKAGGKLIINADFPLLLDICGQKNIKPLTFGQSEPAQIRAENIIYKGLRSSFAIEGTIIELPLPGQANILNALAAWAVCRQFNIKVTDFAKAIETVKPVDMRAEVLEIGPLTVINDCYNANPVSMKNALQILSALNSDDSRRLVFICGDMNELGKEAENFHAELGKQIALAKIQLLITVGKLTLITAQTAKQIANHNIQIICVPDSIIACNILKNFIKDSDIILVKGSRAVKLELTIERLKELFMSGVSASAG